MLIVSEFFFMDEAPQFMKLTASFGLFAWFGVFLASSGLVMFYRCSRYVL